MFKKLVCMSVVAAMTGAFAMAGAVDVREEKTESKKVESKKAEEAKAEKVSGKETKKMNDVLDPLNTGKTAEEKAAKAAIAQDVKELGAKAVKDMNKASAIAKTRNGGLMELTSAEIAKKSEGTFILQGLKAAGVDAKVAKEAALATVRLTGDAWTNGSLVAHAAVASIARGTNPQLVAEAIRSNAEYAQKNNGKTIYNGVFAASTCSLIAPKALDVAFKAAPLVIKEGSLAKAFDVIHPESAGKANIERARKLEAQEPTEVAKLTQESKNEEDQTERCEFFSAGL